MPTRSYRIEYRRDFTSLAADHRLLLTGQPVGGYAAMDDSYGGKFCNEAHARKAGEIFVELGVLPGFQTDERIAIYRVAALAKAAMVERPAMRRAA